MLGDLFIGWEVGHELKWRTINNMGHPNPLFEGDLAHSPKITP